MLALPPQVPLDVEHEAAKHAADLLSDRIEIRRELEFKHNDVPPSIARSCFIALHSIVYNM